MTTLLGNGSEAPVHALRRFCRGQIVAPRTGLALAAHFVAPNSIAQAGSTPTGAKPKVCSSPLVPGRVPSEGGLLGHNGQRRVLGRAEGAASLSSGLRSPIAC